MTETNMYQRVCDVFDAAVELDATARAAFLDDACRDDPLVRTEVESLLESFDGTRTAGLFPPLLRVADAETLAIGERVGPYTLRREIGEGGMGVVYQATREDVGATVAIKLVRHGRLASPEHLRRFLLERRVLARLEHPNIARLLDAGLTDTGLPYLVMEYVDGEPIDRYCDARRLTVEERLALFGHVCDAVHYAHRHLIVHRDLKPSNIAVTSEGVVKLLDFGIATQLEEGSGRDGRLTRTGLVVLTPEYAAPEQVKGAPVTTASDVYALGLLLFELLTGQRPFHRESRTTPEFLQAICEEEPELPSEVVRQSQLLSRSGGMHKQATPGRATQGSATQGNVTQGNVTQGNGTQGNGTQGNGTQGNVTHGKATQGKARQGNVTPEQVTLETVAEARRIHPLRLSRRLAGDLDTIVLKALKKEPERRYLSAQELREDIDRHLAGLPVRARGDSLWYMSRKFVRRYKAAVAAAALIVLTLTVGVITTATQARRAEAERAIAEQRFRDVRALAGALVSDVHDAISDLPGSIPVRTTLVTRALEHLDRLYRQSGDDPILKREIAAAYVELGLVQGNPTVANLGDLAAARRSFEMALSIAHALVAADPSDHAARRTLALAHEKMSDADAWGGRLPQGAEHARKALEQWQSLATASPASVSAIRAVATSHIKLGDILGNPNLPNLSDGAGATREYQRALALVQAVPRDSLSDWPTRRLLALVHERLGSMLNLDGRQAEGIAELEQTLAIREGLVRERGASINALRDLAVTHQVLCEARLAAGDGDRALTHCEQGVALYESLRSTDPRNAQSLHDLALGQMSMHKVLAARSELNASLTQLDRSTALLRQLVSSYHDNVPARRDLARGLLLASQVHARLASRVSGALARRRMHRQRAVTSYEEGQRLLLEVSARGQRSREDSVLVDRVRIELGRVASRP